MINGRTVLCWCSEDVVICVGKSQKGTQLMVIWVRRSKLMIGQVWLQGGLYTTGYTRLGPKVRSSIVVFMIQISLLNAVYGPFMIWHQKNVRLQRFVNSSQRSSSFTSHGTNQTGIDFSNLQIKAAFVFHDPRNWALDTQILLDLVRSGGYIGRPAISASKRAQRDEKDDVELVFCNPDLLWRAKFSQPRLGQGGFKEAFQAVYKVFHHFITRKDWLLTSGLFVGPRRERISIYPDG